MYQKINWKNHIVQYPLRRQIEDNYDGTYNVIPDQGEIIQRGTKQSAENFNHMDEAIFDAILAEQILVHKEILDDNFFNVFYEAEDKDIEEAFGRPYEPEIPPEKGDGNCGCCSCEHDDYEEATDEDIESIFRSKS